MSEANMLVDLLLDAYYTRINCTLTTFVKYKMIYKS